MVTNRQILLANDASKARNRSHFFFFYCFFFYDHFFAVILRQCHSATHRPDMFLYTSSWLVEAKVAVVQSMTCRVRCSVSIPTHVTVTPRNPDLAKNLVHHLYTLLPRPTIVHSARWLEHKQGAASAELTDNSKYLSAGIHLIPPLDGACAPRDLAVS